MYNYNKWSDEVCDAYDALIFPVVRVILFRAALAPMQRVGWRETFEPTGDVLFANWESKQNPIDEKFLLHMTLPNHLPLQRYESSRRRLFDTIDEIWEHGSIQSKGVHTVYVLVEGAKI